MPPGTLYVTMGDPRGIGPEVTLKALARQGPAAGRVRLVGVREVFLRAARACGLEETLAGLDPSLLEIASEAELPARLSEPGAGAAGSGGIADWPPGGGDGTGGSIPAALAGDWAGRAVEAAVRVLRPERGDALVTAPLDKAALQAGGRPYPGHTEMLAALSGAPDSAMMLVAGRLRVSLVTGHVPLRRVPLELGPARLRRVFLLTHHALRTGFGIGRPRVAICGLNPHAGDGGIFGDEEERIVAPVVRALSAEGHDVVGPVPGDTAFVRAVAGEFDAVLALFHDQGMIPVKLHGFGRGVNVTLGLPFVRTSPDHGTARDIAGTGRARPESFEAALALARELAARPEFARPPLVERTAVL